MIHDFCITENHIIFPDIPMECSGPKAVKTKGFFFQFDKSQPARYGVMKKG
jgi:carotenoid cleavage dioxygenase-like enzyme